jgi:hypothetical protein
MRTTEVRGSSSARLARANWYPVNHAYKINLVTVMSYGKVRDGRAWGRYSVMITSAVLKCRHDSEGYPPS